MELLSKFCSLFLTLSLAFASLGAKAENDKLCEYHSQSGSQPDSQPVSQPDSHSGTLQTRNRKLHFNFGAHRDELIYRLFNMIQENNSVDEVDLKELEEMVLRIEPLFQLEKQLKEAQHLRELIQAGKIHWIATEFTTNNLVEPGDTGLTPIEEFRKIKEILKKGGAQPSLIDRLMILFSASAGRYVLLSEPDVLAKIEAVGLDADQNLRQQTYRMIQLSNLKLKELGAALASFPVAQRERFELALSAFRDATFPFGQMSDFEITTLTSEIPPSEAKELLVSVFQTKNILNQLQSLRDKNFVSVINSKKGNGWISVGSAHKTIVDALSKTCLIETTKPAN